MDTIKVVIVNVNEKPYVAEIPNTLKAFREIVGGHIEGYGISNGFMVYVNEEGRLLGLPSNRILTLNGRFKEELVGDFMIFKLVNCEEVSMTNNEAEYFVKLFSNRIVELGE